MILKTSPKIHWTNRAKEKARFYRLSESRILRVLRYPKRKEEGVAPDTVAAMQPAGSQKHPYEIWLMYQIKSQKSEVGSQKVKIISCWRYPGISPVRQPPPIPEDILRELNF